MMLQNKKIVVIGGTNGLGLSSASYFISQGAKVIAVGRNENTNKIAESIFGESGIVLKGDATQENTSKLAIELCVEKWGDFDGLYHVAGGSGRSYGDGPLHEITREGWDKTFELNLTSIMYSNQAAVVAFMNLKKPGSILNMSSVLGYSPSPKFFATHAYSSAKAAIIGFSKSIASFYAEHGIRVNVIAPGLVETPMSQRASKNETIMNYIATKQPLDGGRNGQPQDYDAAACYFMSDYSKFTTGQVLAIDGGWTLSDGQF